jgi:hypothetical protein
MTGKDNAADVGIVESGSRSTEEHDVLLPMLFATWQDPTVEKNLMGQALLAGLSW